MGLPEKHQVVESSEGMIWVIAGVPLRAPLRPVKIKTVASDSKEAEKESTEVTPKEKEARIPERLQCPPAPKKQKPSLRCSLNGVQFFNPPDLNSVFVPRVEKANQV